LRRAGVERLFVVDALNEQVKNFYLHYGFRELLDDPLHLFLPLSTARKLV
jgi:hypothetical protein